MADFMRLLQRPQIPYEEMLARLDDSQYRFTWEATEPPKPPTAASMRPLQLKHPFLLLVAPLAEPELPAYLVPLLNEYFAKKVSLTI
jgi:hypothetical protein